MNTGERRGRRERGTLYLGVGCADESEGRNDASRGLVIALDSPVREVGAVIGAVMAVRADSGGMTGMRAALADDPRSSERRTRAHAVRVRGRAARVPL